MNRIDTTFARCRAEKRKALVMFVEAGDPTLAISEDLMLAVAEAGADIIEVGVPFSDPMADGPAIQAASQRALESGTTLRGILAMVGRLRQRTEVPLILFSYYNVMLQYGVEALARDSVVAGIDAWLVVDVPPEERGELAPATAPHGIPLITLLAPTTPPERAQALLAQAAGFVYYITVTGVTGARDQLPENLAGDLERVRVNSPVPVVAGFGVSTPEMARTVAAHADGVVVGSALVKMMASAAQPADGIRTCAEFVRSLAAAMR
ncbi:MAG: tryptophan synthase subunit alpha [Lentisphaerae bacterium RIFOXYB12_FULL_65_16]|nr:MAG: tryptophan synthase subunit alpha [Lentisphaerae bacterium RIFOXYA12_64_32]OGV87148.1 MAG: tryptophan synthase subunit alpha [Lentisphaerae bacterium RIFOXYB12_FULL_65_16]